MFATRPRTAFAALAVVASIFTPAALRGQTSGVGTISGTVFDASGAAVPKANVEIRDTDTGVSRTLTTNDQGEYAAPFLQPGHYEVIVNSPGFTSNDHKNLVLTVGQVLSVDANLTTAGATSVVQVTVAVNWTSSGRGWAQRAISRSRSMTTYFAEQGLQNYVYNSSGN